MKLNPVLIGLMLLSVMTGVGQASEPNLKRTYLNSWEKEIGYAQVVQKGDTLYISGIVAHGDTLDTQMRDIYEQIGRILKSYGADSGNIIRETIYTKDMEALKMAIPTRKRFYNDGAYPSATWVQIDRLYNEKDLLEIEVEAAVGSSIKH